MRALVIRKAKRLVTAPPTVRAAAAVIVSATAVVVVAAAVAMRLFDAGEFPNIWLSLWWSVQTATTVGYGDITPKTPVGRVIAAVVMLEGIAFLAVVTASITSVFVARAEHELRGGDRWDLVINRLDALDRRLQAIDNALGNAAGSSPPSHDAPRAEPQLNRPQNSSEEASREHHD